MCRPTSQALFDAIEAIVVRLGLDTVYIMQGCKQGSYNNFGISLPRTSWMSGDVVVIVHNIYTCRIVCICRKSNLRGGGLKAFVRARLLAKREISLLFVSSCDPWPRMDVS